MLRNCLFISDWQPLFIFLFYRSVKLVVLILCISRDLRKLENIQEMNISGNLLRHLPRAVGRHGKLQALRCNANLLKELPDFRYSPNLKVLQDLEMYNKN